MITSRLLGGLFAILVTPALHAAFVSESDLEIPVSGPQGEHLSMNGRLCRLLGPPQPLVIINHGSPPEAKKRIEMKLASCNSEAVQWFLRHRFAVLLPLRLGYGSTHGPWTEGGEHCNGSDYVRQGLETARQIDAARAYAATLSGVDASRTVVVGQSAGGWGTLAYDSMPHQNVVGFINMAGGRGGHYRDEDNNNCHPERLVSAAGTFGKTAATPMLWIYAQNDSFFGPPLARQLVEAFTNAGGKAWFEKPAAFGRDGHQLFFGNGGSRTWGPLVEKYLREIADFPGP